MELFTIHCTTCRARLKVKDESAVGSILNCPRCGSMVQVIPPVDWKPSGAATSGAATSGAAAIGGLSVADSAPEIPVSAAARPAPAAEVATKKTPPDLPQRSDATAAAEPPAATPTEPVLPVAAAADPPAANTEPVEPTAPETANAQSWSSQWAARLRADGLLLAGGLSAGAIVGATIWFVVARSTVAPPANVAPAAPVAVASAKSDATVSEPAPNPPVPVKATEPASHDDADQNSAAGALVADSVDPPVKKPVPATATEAASSKAPAETKSTTDAAPDDGTSSVAPSEPAPTPRPQPALRLDPAAAPAASSAALDPLVESILGPASSGDSPPSTGDADALADEPLDNPPKDDAVAVSLTQDDVDAAMAVELGEVKFVGVSLAQFVEFVGDVTALKISVDDAALARQGKNRTMPLSVHLRDTTAADALGAALSPLGLTYELRGNRVFVTVADAGSTAQ